MQLLKKFFSKANLIIYAVILGLIAVDLVTKYLVQSSMDLGQDDTIINGILNFTFILNKGAAWGIFSQSNATLILAIFSLIFAIVMFVLNALVIKNKNWLYFCSFSLILAGTIGNMVDRFAFGSVRDFINVSFISFPVFNVADMFLVVGVAMFCLWYIITIIKEEKESKKEKV